MPVDLVKLTAALVTRGDYSEVGEVAIAAALNEPKHAARRRLTGAQFKAAAVAARAWGLLATASTAAAVNLAAMAETGTPDDAALGADLDDALNDGIITQAQRDALWAAGDTLVSDAVRDGIVAEGEEVGSGDVSRARPDTVKGTVYQAVHPETGETVTTQDRSVVRALDAAQVAKHAAARAAPEAKDAADAAFAVAKDTALAAYTADQARAAKG